VIDLLFPDWNKAKSSGTPLDVKGFNIILIDFFRIGLGTSMNKVYQVTSEKWREHSPQPMIVSNLIEYNTH